MNSEDVYVDYDLIAHVYNVKGYAVTVPSEQFPYNIGESIAIAQDFINGVLAPHCLVSGQFLFNGSVIKVEKI